MPKKFKELKARVQQQLMRDFPEEDLIDYKIKVKYIVHNRTKREFDVDNRIKFMQDCLQGTVILDDKLIYKLQIEKIIDSPSDYFEVFIEEIGQ